MIKYKDSPDSIVSELLLWRETPTQVTIKDTFNVKVHPVTSLYNDGTINFDIPSQPKGLISNVEIVTSFKVKKGDIALTAEDSVSIANNFANALWELVDVKIGDRVDLMQSMRNSYAYLTFFNYVLNSDANREDYLFSTQLFKMDSGVTKEDSEVMEFSGDSVKNKGAADRSKRIARSKSLTVCSRLHCPLLTNSKALPPNMKIRVSLTKNNDKFLLLSSNEGYKVHVEDVYLSVTYITPYDYFLSMIEERLLKQPAPYFVTRPEIIIKPISEQGRVVRVNNVFSHGKIPKLAFFCVQRSKDFEGSFDTNPFTFIPFSKFQFYIDGSAYFNDALEMQYTTLDDDKVYSENVNFISQLYKTIGKDLKGCGLISSKNFQQNFMVALSLTGDRASASAPYLNPQFEAATQLEIDFGYDTNVRDDLILIIYAIYDRVIKIAADRSVEIIE